MVARDRVFYFQVENSQHPIGVGPKRINEESQFFQPLNHSKSLPVESNMKLNDLCHDFEAVRFRNLSVRIVLSPTYVAIPTNLIGMIHIT